MPTAIHTEYELALLMVGGLPQFQIRLTDFVLLAGVVQTLIGGTVFDAVDGPASTAGINAIQSIAVDSSDVVFFGDLANEKQVVRMVSAGVVTTVAGGDSGNTDGFGTSAMFSYISSLTAFNGRSLFATDSDTIRRMDLTGSCYCKLC